MKTLLCMLLAMTIASPATASPKLPSPVAAGRIGASWSPVYGLPPIKPDRFMPQLRALGGSFSRVTLYWTQLEPHTRGDVPAIAPMVIDEPSMMRSGSAARMIVAIASQCHYQ
jgi:hypothetical protein